MKRWLHSDDDCPHRPIFGRREGRLYECDCGRIWRYRVSRGVLSTWRRWELVRADRETP